MSFKAQLSADILNCLLNSDEFAEEITYTPFGQSPKSIKAIIVREGLEPSSENVARSLRKQAEVYIANHQTEGVTAVDKKNDRLSLKDVEGNLKSARINEILHQDAGLWQLLVGW